MARDNLSRPEIHNESPAVFHDLVSVRGVSHGDAAAVIVPHKLLLLESAQMVLRHAGFKLKLGCNLVCRKMAVLVEEEPENLDGICTEFGLWLTALGLRLKLFVLVLENRYLLFKLCYIQTQPGICGESSDYLVENSKAWDWHIMRLLRRVTLAGRLLHPSSKHGPKDQPPLQG